MSYSLSNGPRERWRLYDARTREPTEDWIDLPEGRYPVRERQTHERLLLEEIRGLRNEIQLLRAQVLNQ